MRGVLAVCSVGSGRRGRAASIATTRATDQNATKNAEHHNESENFLHIFFPLHLLECRFTTRLPPDGGQSRVHYSVRIRDLKRFRLILFMTQAESGLNLIGSGPLVLRRPQKYRFQMSEFTSWRPSNITSVDFTRRFLTWC